MELHSCIASELQTFFKRAFYLKQMNFITDSLCSSYNNMFQKFFEMETFTPSTSVVL